MGKYTKSIVVVTTVALWSLSSLDAEALEAPKMLYMVRFESLSDRAFN
jgi:hypothetical protein